MSKPLQSTRPAPQDLRFLSEARHHSPQTFLGPHAVQGATVVRAYLPHAETAWLGSKRTPMARFADSALFDASLTQDGVYELIWRDAEGREHRHADPYAFPPELPLEELAAFNRGEHRRMQRLLGAHVRERSGVAGTRFAVWAPNAERVSVLGDFNRWDG